MIKTRLPTLVRGNARVLSKDPKKLIGGFCVEVEKCAKRGQHDP